MGTSFYLTKDPSSDKNQLHVCRRSGQSWRFQGVYPSSDFVSMMDKDTSVYYYADKFEDLLPSGVKGITSIDDWVYVLSNLPEGVVLVDDNCSGETASELVDAIRSATPRPIGEAISRMGFEEDPTLRSVSQSMLQDEFVDRHGWLFTFRMFS